MKFFITFLIGGLMFQSCCNGGPNKKTFTKGIRKFSRKVIEKIASISTNKNVIFSPLSIYLTMGALRAGAKNNTLIELERTMAIGFDEERRFNIDNLMKKLYNNAVRQQKIGEFKVGNGLFFAEDYPVKSSFLTLMKSAYNAHIEEMDFSNSIEAATRINDWIANMTNDRITNLISASSISGLTRLILTNTVYFKANWAHAFTKLESKQPFHLLNGSNLSVGFIEQSHVPFIYSTTNAIYVAIPYTGNDDYFVVGVPKTRPTSDKEFVGFLKSAANVLEKGKVLEWSSFSRTLIMPEFEINHKFDVKALFIRMGMSTLFDPRECNLLGISDEPLYVSEYTHQAYINVNQNGTEAAAATAVFLLGRSLNSPPIVVDTPFIYGIYNVKAEIYTFMGYVKNPIGE